MIRDRTTVLRPARLSGPGGGRLESVLEPDPGGTLTEGVVVRTRLIARLLGVRLLRVDGTVLIAPARLDGTLVRAAPGRVGPQLPPGEGLARAGRLLRENHRTLRRRA